MMLLLKRQKKQLAQKTKVMRLPRSQKLQVLNLLKMMLALHLLLQALCVGGMALLPFVPSPALAVGVVVTAVTQLRLSEMRITVKRLLQNSPVASSEVPMAATCRFPGASSNPSDTRRAVSRPSRRTSKPRPSA